MRRPRLEVPLNPRHNWITQMSPYANEALEIKRGFHVHELNVPEYNVFNQLTVGAWPDKSCRYIINTLLV